LEGTVGQLLDWNEEKADLWVICPWASLTEVTVSQVMLKKRKLNGSKKMPAALFVISVSQFLS
jgi:hypothetical protein